MKITPEVRSQVLAALEKGETSRDVAKRFGVTPVAIRTLKHRSLQRNATVPLQGKDQSVTSDATDTRSFAPATPATPSPQIQRVPQPDATVGATGGSGAGGAEGARKAVTTAATPPVQTVDPLLLKQKQEQFCIESVQMIKSLLGGGTCMFLQIDAQKRKVPLQLSDAAEVTIKANSEYLAPYLEKILGDHKALWLVLGYEAVALGGVIYRIYREDHPKTEPVHKPAPPPGPEPQIKKASDDPWDPRNWDSNVPEPR